MTRFDAAEPTERRKLFAEAVLAHRRRGSDSLVVEAEIDAGTRVRISARSDANRLSEFVERTFRAVYGLNDDYRAWAVGV